MEDFSVQCESFPFNVKLFRSIITSQFNVYIECENFTVNIKLVRSRSKNTRLEPNAI